jgi:hypothetical protein
MKQFAYWAAACKTEGCEAVHIVSFIGPDVGRSEYAVPDGVVSSYRYECMNCGTKQQYGREDFRVEMLEMLPPPGFFPWF